MTTGGYKHHPIFVRPSQDAHIWRYMDFMKFVDLIDRSALFFPRADQLGDRWEGSVSAVTVAAQDAVLRESMSKTEVAEANLEKLREDTATFRQRLAMFMLVSCWYEAEHESAAMWAVYVREGAGVAIRSTFGGLEQALPSKFPQPIYVGRVRYIDYAREAVPSGNSFFPFLCKRRSFEHERELRAMFDVSTLENMHPLYRHPPTIDHGLHVPVDLGRLIGEIHVAPTAPAWMLELVKRTATRYGVQAPVIQSSLDEDPVY